MEIKAIVIDDEPLAQNVIEQYSLKIPQLTIIGKCNDAICAHEFLSQQNVDLIFLDINMPKMSGISFLKNLQNPPHIIFTTAYSEYALEGFELNAIDYLKKPFSFERFSKAFFRAEEIIRLKRKQENTSSPINNSQFLFVKSNKKTIKLDFTEICFIEGLGDYIKIHLSDQKIVTNLSMKKILSLLPSDKFFRIHKSYIVSVNNIELIEGNMVKVNGIKIPIGNNFRSDFFKFIQSNLAE
jgi:DNA-binding LytR/AlgR family response regulator